MICVRVIFRNEKQKETESVNGQKIYIYIGSLVPPILAGIALIFHMKKWEVSCFDLWGIVFEINIYETYRGYDLLAQKIYLFLIAFLIFSLRILLKEKGKKEKKGKDHQKKISSRQGKPRVPRLE